jgi:hypothetical protein
VHAHTGAASWTLSALAAARSLTVLERTLTTSERISRELLSASRPYDSLHSQDLPAPDPDQDQLAGTED